MKKNTATSAEFLRPQGQMSALLFVTQRRKNGWISRVLCAQYGRGCVLNFRVQIAP